MKIAGWGRYPVIDAAVHTPRSLGDLQAIAAEAPSVIARGNGRAYGDSAVNAKATIDTRRLNRMIAFDEATGVLEAEAGVLLGDVISSFLAKGWFPLVTPGTKFVTLGGAIAADVHGKNHHKDGSFRSCVLWIDLLTADGTVRRCSLSENPELFDHTLGGMGLTGVILAAAIQLRPVESAWIRQTTRPAANLRAAMDIFEAEQEATYSVAWLDCLGRGEHLGRSLVMLGEHAQLKDLDRPKARRPFVTKARRKLSVPLDFPALTLNRFSVKAFNALYYWNGSRKPEAELVDWDAYFYPLDAIHGWNRIYGRKGFAQFQCALPLERSFDGMSALLKAISDAQQGSFLGVLKRFGPQTGAFSFPMEGYTLALDFPVNTRTLALLEHLDEITIDHGGRFYLAKDSRMSAETLRASDPRVEAFHRRRRDDLNAGKFQSAQSERLAL